MSQESKKPSFRVPGGVRRQAISVSQERLIAFEHFRPDQPLPLVVSPAVDDVDLLGWASANRDRIDDWLLQHSGILFRGFGLKEVAEFERLLEAIAGPLLDYSYRSTPRSQVSGKIYTSTEYPADQAIPLHNEMSYTRTWPMKIGFFAVKIAAHGGETPIADSRKVLARIDPAIKERFREKQVMYVRNYGKGIDLPWQEVFQTTDKAEVERFCLSAGIAFEWKDHDRLRTAQVCQAVATHPRSGEKVWFNQAHLFHVSSLPSEARETLLAAFREEDLPRNTYYGDGTPIEPAALDAIRYAYDQETVVFPWQEGDILLLDNMLVAHGRRPFVGPRKTVVGMAESMSGDE
jgi:alpha-ketoglutarate-dependent taurine dioxygenase